MPSMAPKDIKILSLVRARFRKGEKNEAALAMRVPTPCEGGYWWKVPSLKTAAIYYVKKVGESTDGAP